MVLELVILNNCFIVFIILYYGYFDLKIRKISNRFFIICLFISGFFNTLNLFYNIHFSLGDLAFKVFIVFISLIISFYLFSIRILGGSDGKLITILILSKLNFNSLLSFLFFFYFIFIFFYIGMIFIKFLINGCTKYRLSYDIYFNSVCPLSTFQKKFIKTYYIFQDVAKLCDTKEEKYRFCEGGLFFNLKTFKLQILAQYRPPLTLIISLSYIVALLMIG